MKWYEAGGRWHRGGVKMSRTQKKIVGEKMRKTLLIHILLIFRQLWMLPIFHGFHSKIEPNVIMNSALISRVVEIWLKSHFEYFWNNTVDFLSFKLDGATFFLFVKRDEWKEWMSISHSNCNIASKLYLSCKRPLQRQTCHFWHISTNATFGPKYEFFSSFPFPDIEES